MNALHADDLLDFQDVDSELLAAKAECQVFALQVELALRIGVVRLPAAVQDDLGRAAVGIQAGGEWCLVAAAIGFFRKAQIHEPLHGDGLADAHALVHVGMHLLQGPDIREKIAGLDPPGFGQHVLEDRNLQAQFFLGIEEGHADLGRALGLLLDELARLHQHVGELVNHIRIGVDEGLLHGHDTAGMVLPQLAR